MYKIGLVLKSDDVFYEFEQSFEKYDCKCYNLLSEQSALLEDIDFFLIIEGTEFSMNDSCEWISSIRELSDSFIWSLIDNENSEYTRIYLRMGSDGILHKTMRTEDICIFTNNLLKNISKKQSNPKTKRLVYVKNAPLSLDKQNYLLVADRSNKEVKLTRMEFLLIDKMLENYGNILTYKELCGYLWGNGAFGEMYFCRLANLIGQTRHKIKMISSEAMIKNIRRVGYQFGETVLK